MRAIRTDSLQGTRLIFLNRLKASFLTLISRKIMKKSKFSEAQILKVLQTQQEGKKVREI
jgi:hypothetical protein